MIFALEVILEQHREKYGTNWNPLNGKQALEHLILKKFQWPISQIRNLSLQDALFILQEELNFKNLPENAQQMIQMFGSSRANQCFPDIAEEEWDPDLYSKLPPLRHW